MRLNKVSHTTYFFIMALAGMCIFLVGCRAPAADVSAPTPAASMATPMLPTPTAAPFTLTSLAFAADADIPERHACHGENLSPALAWTTPPANTQSLVLIMDDPDAVPVAGRVWDHWVLFNIPPTVTSLPEGLPKDAELPDGSQHGRNSSSQTGYAGPCPPSGQTHGYVFTLYAVDTRLDLEPRASKQEVLDAMEGHILAQAELIGMYTSP